MAAMKFCAVMFLVYLPIDADARKRKKNCKQIMDKLSDLKELIKKKQDCCTVGKVYRIVSVVMRGEFHEGLNSDCQTILIYKNTVLTEEQIKANHYFFLIGYNIDADPVA